MVTFIQNLILNVSIGLNGGMLFSHPYLDRKGKYSLAYGLLEGRWGEVEFCFDRLSYISNFDTELQYFQNLLFYIKSDSLTSQTCTNKIEYNDWNKTL